MDVLEANKPVVFVDGRKVAATLGFLFGFALAWMGRRLLSVMVLAGALTVIGAMHYGLADIGPVWAGAPFGFARALFWFVLGIALTNVHATGRQSWVATALIALLPAVFWFASVPLAVVILPLAVICAIRFDPHLPRLCKWLGGLSYPLYCIHYPLLFVAMSGIERFGLPQRPTMAAVIVALIVIAAMIERYVDAPIRVALARSAAIRKANIAPA